MATPSLAQPVAKAEPAVAADAKVAALAFIDSQASTLSRVNRDIWTYAETGLAETRSSQQLQDWLRANNFSIESGVAGMPTAFVASYGTGKPVIGLLAEFDALPGLSQDDSPKRSERPGVAAGHGCGHSLFGTASTAAAIAIQRSLAAGDIKGTVHLYGTPAEETGIGKTYMLREGVFKDVDVMLSWHARDITRADFSYTKANLSVKFRFEGLAAHASTSPHEGRSALDAVELMSVGVNYMREHIKPDARIHYVITNGGGAPNVVPPVAEVWYFIRADRHNDVEGYFAWVKQIAEAAAVMSRTKLAHVQIDADMHEVLPNRALSELIYKNLVAIGAPTFTESEKAFARTTQADLPRKPALALSERVEPLATQAEQVPTSTDIGGLSWFVPVGSLTAAAYTYGAPGHSWQVVASTGTSIGDKGMMVAAKALAASAIDLYRSPELVAKAKADFAAIRKPLTYVTLIPKGQKAPKAIR